MSSEHSAIALFQAWLLPSGVLALTGAWGLEKPRGRLTHPIPSVQPPATSHVPPLPPPATLASYCEHREPSPRPAFRPITSERLNIKWLVPLPKFSLPSYVMTAVINNCSVPCTQDGSESFRWKNFCNSFLSLKQNT